MRLTSQISPSPPFQPIRMHERVEQDQKGKACSRDRRRPEDLKIRYSDVT